LINFILITWSVLGTFGYFLTCLRSLSIGWTTRDIIYTANYAVLMIITLYRHRLSVKTKAIILVIVNTFVGAMGFLTLGMLAGGVFFFPMIIVILALFYSRRSLIIFTVGTTALFTVIAYGFITGRLVMKTPPDILITLPAHWASYIFCMIFFFMVTAITITSYRQTMTALMFAVSRQRNKLDINNRELQRVLQEIKTLKGIIPICMHCKEIRDDKGSWKQLEKYIAEHSDAEFSHSICDKCMEKFYPE
jgi:hypothetical protein